MSLALAAAMFGAQGGQKAANRLAEELGLSDEQKPKVAAIMKEQREALKAAREKKAGRDAMREIQAKTETKMKEVLTEDQMKKWDTFRAEQKKKAKKH
jgi:Spy/CpxP family protein refolding chaperone